MKSSVFDFSDYKAYLLARTGKPGTRSGIRSEISSAIGCNTTYVSQVLNGAAHFSLEQAQKLNSLFGHTEDESHFFLLLVQLDRAGTPALRKYFEIQIQKISEQRLNIQRRLGVKKSLNPNDQAVYYGAWYYPAIHVALSVPELRDPAALSKYFDLPLKTVGKVIEFLLSVGLATQGSRGLEIGPTYIHLGKDSENILRHHTNWRLQAIDRLDAETENDIHYASAVTLSRKDALKIKDLIVENIKEMNKTISESKEEEVYCFITDFFRLGKKSR